MPATEPTPQTPAPAPASPRSRLLPVAILAIAAVTGVAAAFAGASIARYGLRGVRGNRIFYDQYHVHRHFIEGENVRGEWAYHITSGYADFKRALEDAGYEVVVHKEGRIGPGDLDGFDIFFVGEEARNGPEMTNAERREILRFVKNGGGLWAVTEHTNAHEIGARFNKLMAPVGIQARYDSVCEDNGSRGSRDWLEVTDFKPHPVTRNMEILYTYNGCSFDTRYGIAFSSPQSFSDAWNPNTRGKERGVHNGDNIRQPDEPMGPFPVVAARPFGRGHVIAICDHNALSNTNLRDGSHQHMLLDGMAWLGHRHWNPEIWLLLAAVIALAATLVVNRRWSVWPMGTVLVVAGLGLVVATGAHLGRARLHAQKTVLFLDGHGHGPLIHKKDGSAFGMLVKHTDKADWIRSWSQPRLRSGDDVIVLPGVLEPFDARELGILDGALNTGRSVVYVATKASLASAAGQQLARRYEFEVRPRPGTVRGEIRLEGDSALRAGLRNFGIRNTVTLAEVVAKGRRVRLVAKQGDLAGDFVTELPRRGGRFIVVAPGELFENTNMVGKTKRTLRWIDLLAGFFHWAARPAS